MADAGVGYLADVDALVGVDADAVRGDELADVEAVPISQTLQHLPGCRHDRDPRADIGHVTVDAHSPPQLADVDALILVYVDRAGPVDVVPHVFDAAIAVEDLDAVVLPVADVDIAVPVGGDVVDDVELTGIGPR